MDNRSFYFENIISNINSENIHKDIESKNITIENIKDNNSILKNLFDLAIKENFSFTIIKITRSKTKVSIFSENSDDFHFFIKIRNNDNLIKDLCFSIKKTFLKVSKFNPVIGTDGVGKTTIIENLVNKKKDKLNPIDLKEHIENLYFTNCLNQYSGNRLKRNLVEK